MPLAAAFDLLTLAQLTWSRSCIGLADACCSSVSYNTIFVALLPRDDYMTGSALLNGSRAVSFVAGTEHRRPAGPGADGADGPAGGRRLVRVLGGGFLRAGRRRRAGAEPGVAGNVTAGLSFLVRNPIMRAAWPPPRRINLFNFIFFALLMLFATRDLHVSPAALGLVLGSAAIGSVIGSLVTGPIERRIGVGPAFALGCFLFPAPLVLVPLAGGPHCWCWDAVPGRVRLRARA